MNGDAPDLRHHQDTIVQPRAVAIFLEGEGVVAIPSPAARTSGLLAPLDAPEERLIGLVERRQHIL
jgi:hypothetical protein